MADGGLAGLMGAYGTDEEEEEIEEEEGGRVTILGRSETEEDIQGLDLSHLTTAAAVRPELDTAATQPAAAPELPPGQQPDAQAPNAEAGAVGALEGMDVDVTAAQPATEAGAAALLPSEILQPPEGECNPALQAKVAAWLNVQRTRGRYINTELRHSRGYRNPEFFRKMVEHLEIDEHGSSFAKEVFDPHGLPKEDFIDELQKEWAAEEERRKAVRQQTGRIEFTKSASQPQLAPPQLHNPLLPGLNPAMALAAAQAKAAALAAAGAGVSLAQPGAAGAGGKSGSKWDATRR